MTNHLCIHIKYYVYDTIRYDTIRYDTILIHHTSEPTSVKKVVAETTKEDAADAKAEAKARQKEARARQMAAADAAVAN